MFASGKEKEKAGEQGRRRKMYFTVYIKYLNCKALTYHGWWLLLTQRRNHYATWNKIQPNGDWTSRVFLKILWDDADTIFSQPLITTQTNQLTLFLYHYGMLNSDVCWSLLFLHMTPATCHHSASCHAEPIKSCLTKICSSLFLQFWVSWLMFFCALSNEKMTQGQKLYFLSLSLVSTDFKFEGK